MLFRIGGFMSTTSTFACRRPGGGLQLAGGRRPRRLVFPASLHVARPLAQRLPNHVTRRRRRRADGAGAGGAATEVRNLQGGR